MRYPFPRHGAAVLLLLFSPWTVHSCEDQCMTGVTNAFIHLYSVPVSNAMLDLEAMTISEFFPNQHNPRQDTLATLDYMAAFFSAWQETAPARSREDIFPRYFHGKCQRDFYNLNGSFVRNEDPPGCPNPDCPVVCGTPGSLVHFYSKLVNIVYESHRTTLQELTLPNSTWFKAVAVKIARRQNLPTHMSSKFALRKELSGDLNIGKRLERITRQLLPRLEFHCGGSSTGKTSGLTACSWEQEMKEYILRFP